MSSSLPIYWYQKEATPALAEGRVSSSLTVTSPGVDTANGGSFGYSSILAEPLRDDPTQGAIAFDHHLPGPRCNAKKPAPHDCGASLFARFPLDF